MAKGMNVDMNGLRRNIVEATNALGKEIEELIIVYDCYKPQGVVDAHNFLRGEVWTLANISGGLDELLKPLYVDMYEISQ